MSTSTRIKLVAIAKDEAAYLPEWIAHHVALGFDAIDIYINRTSDNSEEILRNIQQAYPQVHFECADWVDQAGPRAAARLQFIVYSQAFYQAKQAQAFSHICFLDIDEFYIDQVAGRSIHDTLNELPSNSVLYLQWLIDQASATPFSYVPNTLTGKLSALGKCIIPTQVDIELSELHLPKFADGTAILTAAHETFIESKHYSQGVDASISKLHSRFIYHRANRSELEYISLCLRGRPSSTSMFKENRTGLPGIDQDVLQIQLIDDRYTARDTLMSDFIRRCKIASALEQARVFIRERRDKAVKALPVGLEQDYACMKRIFARVTAPDVIKCFADAREKLAQQMPECADTMRDLARDAVFQDIDEGLYYIEKALSLRPQGPLIKRIKDEFLAMKQQQETNK